MKKGKLLIFSAPSGSGKSTIVQALIKKDFELEFSVSATSRAPRGDEQDGIAYHFLSVEEFRQKINQGDFLEWEEVYKNNYYGTLRSEVERITSTGKNIIFDVDVIGGINIKKEFKEEALSIFVQPPSIEELRKRLIGRATDAIEKIEQRLAKAEYELTFASQFDHVVINDNLEQAIEDTEELLTVFLKK